MKTVRALVFIGLTNAISLMGFVWFSDWQKNHYPVSQVLAETSTITAISPTLPVPTLRPIVKTIVIKVTATPPIARTSVATTPPAVTTAPPAQAPPTQPPTTATGCIIVIDGGRYDVTAFRGSHSGGDIFSCGQDMSQTFWGQHGQKQLSTMQKYRI